MRLVALSKQRIEAHILSPRITEVAVKFLLLDILAAERDTLWHTKEVEIYEVVSNRRTRLAVNAEYDAVNLLAVFIERKHII